MSYNLQSSISNACVSNAPTQAGYMNTDFVGNQEVAQGVDTRCNCVMPKIIADTTGKSTRFVMTFPWRTGQYGIGLGTSQTILDTKYYLYNYNGAEQRALVAVKTKPPGLNGKALWFISTHLDYTVWAARQAQASQLIQWVKDNIVSQDSTASVAVVGDFNGGPDDQFYGTLKTFFKNAWEVYHGSTAGGQTYPSSGPTVRFDHLWYYTPSSVSAQITSVEVVNTQASDHRPLKVYIKFTTSGSAPAPAATPAPTKAPTPAPTKAATSAPTPATPAPTKAATSAPTSAPASSSGSGSCSVSLDFNLLGNFISVRNTGSKAIKALELTFSPSVPSNNWNLVATSSSNVKTLPDFAYQSLGVGQTYTSSGFWTAGTKPTITATRVTC